MMTFADVTLPGGVRIHYVRQGPKFGKAMILLHGYSDSSLSFSRVMPLLPAEMRVIAPDLRGHGASERPASGYRIVDMAGDVLRMMDALDVSSAIIVGHSMGSFVAQAIAERVPERVSSLVLLASGPRPDNRTLLELRASVEAFADEVDPDFVREFQYSTIALDVPETFMQAVIDNSLRMPASVWKQAIAGIVEYEPAARRPPVRTLVLGGKKDSVFSVAEQTQLARQFPDGRLQLFDAVGHTLHWELPEMFVEAVMRFAR